LHPDNEVIEHVINFEPKRGLNSPLGAIGSMTLIFRIQETHDRHSLFVIAAPRRASAFRRDE